MQHFYVVMVSRDLKAPVDTIRLLQDLGYSLQRPTVFVNSTTDTSAFSRSMGLLILKDAIKKLENSDAQKARAVLLDADILLENKLDVMKDYVTKADKENESFVIPYRTNMGTSWSVRTNPNTPIKDWSEIEKLEWKKVPYSDLGFYYGDIPLDYRFHEKYLDRDNTAGWISEGVNFFRDNRIKPRVATKIRAYNIRFGIF